MNASIPISGIYSGNNNKWNSGISAHRDNRTARPCTLTVNRKVWINKYATVDCEIELNHMQIFPNDATSIYGRILGV